MEERYIRNIGAITEAEQSLLLNKKVFVAGCGGLGGNIIDMLLRIGVGEIRCADGDEFCESNLNRQIFSNENNLGTSKAKAALNHACNVNSSITFVAYTDFIKEDNATTLIGGCDIVIDALDNIESRKILKNACNKLNIPYVFGAVQGWIAQAAILNPNDTFLDIIYPPNSTKAGKEILAFTPSLCASLQVSLCIKYLCNRPVEYSKLYYFDLGDTDFQTINV